MGQNFRPAPTRRSARPLAATMIQLWRAFLKDLFDPYHPEQHYMRGPGPKWHAKHATT